MVFLSGWKQIATYLKHGVRTVQRWEQFGLPVRRPQGKSRSHVVALPEQLDVWLRATPVRSLDEISRLQQRIAELEADIVTLRAALDQRRRRTIKPTTLRLAARKTPNEGGQASA